ncbi:MAG: O-antigen ligase family protein [Flavobacteriales bacterium]
MSVATWNNLLRSLHFAGLAIVMVALPFSNFLMSFGMFWLAGVLVLQVSTDIARKQPVLNRWKQFSSNSSAMMLSGLFLLPLIGLLWTTHFDYAMWDLRMKLPILVLPLLISCTNPITQGEFRALIGLFILAVVVAVMWCLQVYWMGSPEIDGDVRKISVFISHVRFSLLIALALGLLIRFAHGSTQGRILIVLCAVPCLYFIYIIGSITGAIGIGALLLWTGVRFLIQEKKNSIRWIVGASLLLLFTASLSYVYSSYRNYFTVESCDWNTLDEKTTRGELYAHHPEFKLIEDGHYVMTYVAWGELYDAWNERSRIHPDSADARGHVLKGTLIRYLASKGMRKDADGVAMLSEEDIHAIESGVPTATDAHMRGLQKRLHRIYFEWSNYRAGGDPDGHSITQRLEFWKTAVWIIQRNVWTGVGTGDVKEVFRDAYVSTNSPLSEQYRLRAHNQYLTMWITYGAVGFVVFLLITCWPLFVGHAKNPIVVMIVLLAALSYLTEDTLESQAGVMFVAFFYSLFTSKRAVSLAELRRPKSKEKNPLSDAPAHK